MIGGGLVPLNVMVSSEMKRRLKHDAARDGIKVSELVRTLLEIATDSPDKNCKTLPNGDCIGGPCMHDEKR